jgi:hypothetical protein
MDLIAEGSFDQVTIDADQSEKLVKLLDTVVIKLEGGTELDLQVLDNPPQPAVDKVCLVSFFWLLISFIHSVYYYFYSSLLKTKERLSRSPMIKKFLNWKVMTQKKKER